MLVKLLKRRKSKGSSSVPKLLVFVIIFSMVLIAVARFAYCSLLPISVW